MVTSEMTLKRRKSRRAKAKASGCSHPEALFDGAARGQGSEMVPFAYVACRYTPLSTGGFCSPRLAKPKRLDHPKPSHPIIWVARVSPDWFFVHQRTSRSLGDQVCQYGDVAEVVYFGMRKYWKIDSIVRRRNIPRPRRGEKTSEIIRNGMRRSNRLRNLLIDLLSNVN